MRATATPAEIERFRLEAGNVLITKDSETWNDIGVPALVTEAADDLISGYHLALLRPFANELSGGYLLRALQSKGLAYQFHVEAKGVTRYGLSHASIKSVWLPLPPLPEQAAIARYLDHVDRRVGRLVRAKRKLIALLTEQKQAIIHRAVTRGLNPDVPLKDSGVEWLGEVPAHWEVVPLKRAFISMTYGISDSGTAHGTIPVLTMGHIKDGSVTVPESGGVDSVNPDLLLQDKDLLFNRTNSAELVAKVGLFRSAARPVTFASYLVRMRSRKENIAEFLNLLLNDGAFLATARREAIPSLHQSNLNPTRYGRLQIHLPPTQEQEAIVHYIFKQTSNLDAAVFRANHEIDLLNEYHTRLVADVVTGKLDVREAVAALPEVDPLATAVEADDTLDTDTEADIDEMEAISEEDEP